MHTKFSADLPDIADIHLARARISDQTRITPVLNDPGLDKKLGCRLFCKCENLQRTGSFKFRGASNAVLRLREECIEGDVATHSSGNHGAALALAAKLDGRQAHIVMPGDSMPMKIDSVREALSRLREQGENIRLIAVRLLAPERPTEMTAALKGVKRLLIVEQSHSKQFHRYLRAAYDLPGDTRVFNRPGPLPFRPGEIIEQLGDWSTES